MIAMVAAVLLLVAVFTCYRRGSTPGVASGAIPGDTGPAITVEVLNSTDVGGLARDVTRRLRRRGIDVVYFGSSADRRNLDSTVILVRRGDTTAAVAVRDALGGGKIAVELDPDRLLDASVLVGRDLAVLDGHP